VGRRRAAGDRPGRFRGLRHPRGSRQPADQPPARGARTRRSMTRSAPFPSRPIRRWSDVNSDPEVATTDSTGACSCCLMASDLRLWSPRSDSNRRPSDYESKSLRPAGAAQTRSGCSRQRGRPLSAFLTCRVMAGGMTKRMTELPQGSPTEPWRPSDPDRKVAHPTGKPSRRSCRIKIRHLPTGNRKPATVQGLYATMSG
jgi:hypothetical protein